MLNTIFGGLFDTQYTTVISVQDFLLCVLVSLLTGLLLACVYQHKSRSSRSFLITLAMLPAIVCVVILMVNGNVGTGVAVAGAFSLVRFRSAAGSAKEIGAIFMAMCAGLIAGMGYLAYAVLFTLVMSGVLLLYNQSGLGNRKNEDMHRILHITIPEELDYTGVFDEILEKYTTEHELMQVKTTNMGSLFKLTYRMVFKDPAQEKELLDKLRCRNGNLEISISHQETESVEL